MKLIGDYLVIYCTSYNNIHDDLQTDMPLEVTYSIERSLMKRSISAWIYFVRILQPNPTATKMVQQQLHQSGSESHCGSGSISYPPSVLLSKASDEFLVLLLNLINLLLLQLQICLVLRMLFNVGLK